MKTGSGVKIGIFFLVRGTLLILINNVLVKCYCGVLFLGQCSAHVQCFYASIHKCVSQLSFIISHFLDFGASSASDLTESLPLKNRI